MAKNSGIKIVLIVLAVVVGLAVLGVGICALSGYLWFEENAPAMREVGERGQSEAREFAAAHDQNECIDEGFRRHDACGTGMEIMCRAETRVFLDRCLEQATPTPALCDGVPPPTEIMDSADWAVRYCRDHERARDQHCGNFVGAIIEYCGRVAGRP